MNNKSTIAKVTTLGLLTTTLAFTNLEVATSKTGSASSTVALQLNVGEPASAGNPCNRTCQKAASLVGERVFRHWWNNRNK
ncbi:MAG TPA: hypothetical protein ACFCUY_06630 [Xenococcaceae cyanobacterium]